MARFRTVYAAIGAAAESTGCIVGALTCVGRRSPNASDMSAAHKACQNLQRNWGMPCSYHTLCTSRAWSGAHHACISGGAQFRAAGTMAANDLRRGAIISQERGSKLLEVLEAFHSAGQARQGGFVTLECKDVRTGAKSKMKLAPSKTVEVAETQWRKMQYLYMDEDGIHVMDMENYEQFCVPKASAQGVVDWLQDDLEVSGLMHQGFGKYRMPFENNSIVRYAASWSLYTRSRMCQTFQKLKVAETTEARMSVAANKKSAVVSTGATVMVPSFVQKGEYIIVAPARGEFVSRAKQ